MKLKLQDETITLSEHGQLYLTHTLSEADIHRADNALKTCIAEFKAKKELLAKASNADARMREAIAQSLKDTIRETRELRALCQQIQYRSQKWLNEGGRLPADDQAFRSLAAHFERQQSALQALLIVEDPNGGHDL